MRRIRWRRVALAALLALAAVWWLVELAGNLYNAPGNFANDFWTYRQAGLNVLAGSPLYPADEISHPFILPSATWGHGFVYPPFAAVLCVPLALVPPAVGYLAFVGLTAITLAGVAAAIARHEGLAGPRWAVLVGALALINGPAVGALASANLNGLVAAALGLLWLTPRWSGWVSVVGGLVKLFPGAGVVWAWRMRAPLARPIALGVALFVASLLLFGPRAWLDFVAVLNNARPSSPYYIQSVARVFGPLVGYASAAALLGLVLVVPDGAIAFALLSLAMVAPAPDIVPHYMLIPMIGVLPLVSRFIAHATGATASAVRPRAAQWSQDR